MTDGWKTDGWNPMTIEIYETKPGQSGPVIKKYYHTQELFNYRGGNGNTIIHFSAVKARPDILENLLLLATKEDIDKPNDYEATPLSHACELRPEHVEIFLRYGANPRCVTKFGWTPLHYACNRPKSFFAVKFLLKEGVDIGARNDVGKMVIDYTIEPALRLVKFYWVFRWTDFITLI